MPLSKEFLLTLLNTPKIGKVSAKTINDCTSFKVTSVSDLYDAIVDAKNGNPRVPLPDIEVLRKANDQAQFILETCEKKGVIPISINDELYPIKLFRLSDNPIVIYVKGSTSAVNSQFTAGVIGTREPSPFGVKAGRRIANILGRHGFSIVSGLALGCDTAGHLGALDANIPTIAVLASGVDFIYPKENQYLADRIIEQGGALFSEYEIGVKPQRSTFVERDRLQTGLSNGLVVVETDIVGGTMHAVKCAQKLNVPLGCISNHPESLQDFPKIRGNKNLIENGAYALGNIDQIFTFIQVLNPNITTFIPEAKTKDSDIKTSENSFSNIVDTAVNSINTSENVSTSSVDKKEIRSDIEPITGKILPIMPLDEIAQKMDELNIMIAKLFELQESNTKMLNTILAMSTPKEKSAKEKTPKPDKNQPKLL